MKGRLLRGKAEGNTQNLLIKWTILGIQAKEGKEQKGHTKEKTPLHTGVQAKCNVLPPLSLPLQLVLKSASETTALTT